ncbi:MAG: extracellular solute-binding protein family 5 [Streptosporangiaceae bacterium]|nr:extracellular solute-binding protein family 5 [Streptosporangiaceae bacterium]
MTSMRSRLAGGLVAISATALLLTACTAGGAPQSTSSPDVLTVAASPQVTDLNPLTSSAQGKSQTFGAIASPILYADPSNKVVSDILDSWTTSSDATSVTLKLKSGLQWSDGQPITSEDLRQSLAAYLAPGIGTNSGSVGAIVGKADLGTNTNTPLNSLPTPGLTVVDNLTLKISLAAPDSVWTTQWALIGTYEPLLPSHVLGTDALSALSKDTFFTTWPVSSGAYKLTTFTSGESVEMTANDKWSGGTPGFKTLVYKLLGADQALAQLQTGEVQYIAPIAPADVATAKGNSKVTVTSASTVYPDVLTLNYASPRLQSTQVRQAIAYAIDRNSICQQVLGGNCTVSAQNYRLLGPDWALPTTGVTDYSYDPAKAKQLLTAANWDPNTTLTFLTRNTEAPAYVAQAFTIIQQELAAVGVKVNMVDVSTADFLNKIKDTTSYDGFWINGANFAVDPAVMANYYLCANKYPAGGNTSQYCNPTVDALFAQGLTQTDQTARAATYQQILTTLNQDPTEISLYVVNYVAAYNSHLTGPKPDGWITTTFNQIGTWHWS